ncbi:MAG: PEP-CTERM sorting domain-containing protein, partial [Armatimonadota bacterium]
SFRRSARRSMNIIQAGFHDGPTRTADAPPGGFHEFRITRRGNVLSAYLDDELFLSGAGIAEDVRFVTLAFSGDRGMPAQLLVDSVSVVPEPASVAALAGCTAMLGRRRRRTRR